MREGARRDDERDDDGKRRHGPRRGAPARRAEREPGQHRERQREQRQRAHGLVGRDRAQRPDRVREVAGETSRPRDREHAERHRDARGAPAAHDREHRQGGRQRSRVERRELAGVRAERAEDDRRVGPAERADARRIDDAVRGRRARDELEPRQQGDGGEAERGDARGDEDREPAPAQLQHEHDERRGGGDGRQLLRAAEDREREGAREHERRGAAPLAVHGVLRRGDAPRPARPRRSAARAPASARAGSPRRRTRGPRRPLPAGPRRAGARTSTTRASRAGSGS